MQHSRSLAGSTLTIVPLTPARYEGWNQFCRQNDAAWFWHTSHWLEYTLHYRPELHPKNYSFFCQDENRIAAICPLVREAPAPGACGGAEFSYGGDPCPAPVLADSLSQKERKRVARAVLDEVEALAGRLVVQRVSFSMSSLSRSFAKMSGPQANPLLKHGFGDISLATQIIDLSAQEQQLLHGMRKGHRADIARAAKHLACGVLDATTITPDAFDSYRRLHHKAAGRVTRPLETFRLMYEWICQGMAVLAQATLSGRDVGFALVSFYKGAAYYSSSCEDPEHNQLPIGHLMQWKIMKWLQEHGILRYEIGIQTYGNLLHAPATQKDLNIALFKRGFGGTTVPLWRAEKFYDREYCFEVLAERSRRYAEGLSRTHKQETVA